MDGFPYAVAVCYSREAGEAIQPARRQVDNRTYLQVGNRLPCQQLWVIRRLHASPQMQLGYSLLEAPLRGPPYQLSEGICKLCAMPWTEAAYWPVELNGDAADVSKVSLTGSILLRPASLSLTCRLLPRALLSLLIMLDLASEFAQ